jgi:hypothetical protein
MNEKQREATRKWQLENRDKVYANTKRWQEKNRDKLRENTRKWQAKNKDKVKENTRKWQTKNKDKVLENTKRWQADNKDKIKDWQIKNKQKRYESAWKHKLQKNFNITPEIYNQKFKEQTGLCKICNKGQEQKLAVDHCHTTGKVRDLLCRKCNLGLGCFFDNVDLLQKSIQYLLSHNTVSR